MAVTVTRKNVKQVRLVVGTAVRYFANVVSLTKSQEGWLSAVRVSGNLIRAETAKIPRAVRLARRRGRQAIAKGEAPIVDIRLILEHAAEQGIAVEHVSIDREAVVRHLHAFRYPRFYAGGAIESGGAREAKILEYFVSLECVPVMASDVVIDVASERSVFPELVRALTGARVYRQDLIYPPGIQRDRIGGSADTMPVPPSFADKLFLHNSFEHFEGDTDTKFIREAWRVLKSGGGVCIVPLYLSTRHQIVTDPLLDTRDVEWDRGAEIVERIGHHNRFGRFYSVATLEERVLGPARACGFKTTLYHFVLEHADRNDVITRAQRGVRFALVLTKASTEPA
jgi:SAM-dependent methyltransferase